MHIYHKYIRYVCWWPGKLKYSCRPGGDFDVKLALVLWSGPAGLWLAAALRPRGHGGSGRRSRGRNITHDVLNYSNPGKESWPGHGAFRGARCRRRGSRLRRPLTRRGAAYKYWRTLGRRKMDQCGNLRALWGGLIGVLVRVPSALVSTTDFLKKNNVEL
jgi:hypothetical protein